MLLFGSNLLLAIGATHIEAFGDLLLVVQWISYFFDESLNVYLDKCLYIISTLGSLILLLYLYMTIEEQMSWHNRHPTIMLFMVYFILLKSRC